MGGGGVQAPSYIQNGKLTPYSAHTDTNTVKDGINCGELLKIASFFVKELEKLRSFDFFGFICDSHSSFIV
jgi:hypothetical protein